MSSVVRNLGKAVALPLKLTAKVMEKLYKGSAKVTVRARKACGKCGPKSCQRCSKSFAHAFITCKKQCKKVSGKAGRSVTSLRSRYCWKHLNCCDPFRRSCSQCKKVKGKCFTRLRACGCKRPLQCPSRGSKGTFIGLCWFCPMRDKHTHNATQSVQTSPSSKPRNNERRQQYKSSNAAKETKTRGQRADMKHGSPVRMKRHDKKHRTDHATRHDSKKHRHRDKKAQNDGISAPHISASVEEGQSLREEAKASGKKATRTKEKSSQERHKRTLRPSSKNSEKRRQETPRSIEEKLRAKQELSLLTSSEVHAERNETTRKTKKKSGAREHKNELPVSPAIHAGSEYDGATIDNTGTSKTQKDNGLWRALPESREVKIDEQKVELQVNEVRTTAISPSGNSKIKAKQSRAPARDRDYETLGKDNSKEENCQDEEETSIVPASTAQGIRERRHQKASNSKKPEMQSEKGRDLNSRAGASNESKRFQQNVSQEELPMKNEVQGQLKDDAQQIDQRANGARRTQKHKDANANAISGIAKKKNSHGNSEQQTKQVHKRKTQEKNQALDRRHSPTGTTPAPAEGAKGANENEEQNHKHNTRRNDVTVLQSSSTTHENAERCRKNSQGTRGPARQPTGESQKAEGVRAAGVAEVLKFTSDSTTHENAERCRKNSQGTRGPARQPTGESQNAEGVRAAGVAEVLKFTSDGFPTNSSKTTKPIQRQENTEDSGTAQIMSTPTKAASRSSICCGDHEGQNTLLGIECRLRPELP